MSTLVRLAIIVAPVVCFALTVESAQAAGLSEFLSAALALAYALSCWIIALALGSWIITAYEDAQQKEC